MTQRLSATLLLILLCALPAARGALASPLQRDILELEKQIIRDGSDAESMLHLARLYIVSGDHEDARKMLERVLALRPNDADVLTELGFLKQAGGKTTEARAFYMKALAQNPDHPVASLNLGLSYLQTGERDNAAAALKSALQTNVGLLKTLRATRPENPEELRDYNSLQVHYLSNLALCYRALGQPDTALKMLNEAKILAPSDRVLAANITAVQQEIAASPRSSSSKLVTADELQALKTRTPQPGARLEAVPPLPSKIRESVVRRDQPQAPVSAPEDPQVATSPRQAPANQETEEPQQATASTGDEQQQPQPTGIPEPVGLTDTTMPSTAESAPAATSTVAVQEPEFETSGEQAHAQQAVTAPIAPEEAAAHDRAGDDAMMHHDYESAAVEYERAVQLNPENANLRLNLAIAYRKKGNPESALRAAQQAADMEPGNLDIQIALAELEAASGRGRDAEARAAAAMQKHPDSEAARVAYCTVLLDSSQEVRALGFGQQWLNRDSASAPAAACAIRALHARGKFFEAIQVLKSALEHNPADEHLLALKTRLVQEARENKIAIPDLPGADEPPVKTVRIGLDNGAGHPLADFPAFGHPSPPLQEADLGTPQGGAISPRKQPIPVPPSLSDEIKNQISAFQADAYLAPPDLGYDWETLYALRSRLKGRWVFQRSDGRLYEMQAGIRPGRVLAQGAHPSMSADGKALVFVSGGRGGHSIIALNPETRVSDMLLDSARMKLPGKVYFRMPDLSPNRKYLSVLANRGDGVHELTILDTISKTLMRPLPGQNVHAAAWDASGRSVFFSVDPCVKAEDGTRQCLGSFNLDTGRVTWFDATAPSEDGGSRVPVGNIKSAVPVLSPSGNQLLVYSAETYISSVSVVNLETGAARKLDPRDIKGARVAASGLAWSPDEKQFLFLRGGDLWVMDADGGNAFPAEQNLDAAAPVIWRP
jgi:tetratricopeptide (TPR) repeat protein